MTATVEEAAPGQLHLHRAEGVELIGEMAGSGYRIPPSLARRGDGQTIALTPLLYATLREIDGLRTPAEVAAAVSESTGRDVSADNVAHFVDKQLRPLGLLVRPDGSQPRLKKKNPLLGLKLRCAVTDPERTQRLTDPFRVLFLPWVVMLMLAAFAVVCWWVFFHKGLASAAYEAFERPELLILVFVVSILSAGFHEFGHAAAARYGGATPGVIGFAVYLVWPAFYTDVTDSYRLGRAGRLRTDLGGLYFNAIVAVAITGLWMGLRYDALLLVVATQILQMLRQLSPLVRFDGYHVLADLTGVPDLFARIKPTLLGALPWRWGDPKARELKPWARVVVTLWVLVVVPLLLSTLALAILALPRLIGTAWASLGKQQDVLATAWTDGDMIQAVARVLAMIAIVIPMAGIIYMLIRLFRRTAVKAWTATAGMPMKRLTVAVIGIAALGAIAYAWLPHDGNYRPIQPWERGTVLDIALMPSVSSTVMKSDLPRTDAYAPRAAGQALVAGQTGVFASVWDTRTPPPTRAAPQLALVLVPKADSWSGGDRPGNPSASVAGASPTTAVAPGDRGWVFPVDKPLARDPSADNQALAMNTTDGTVDYEAAFALVYVTNDEVGNVNEAQAYASCESCAAVAVAFQVVFVIDTDETDDNILAPQNLAGALNYDCVNCLTYALAEQIVITLDRPLTPQEKAQLTVVWAKMAAYGHQIEAGRVPLNEIPGKLDEFEAEIRDIAGPAVAQPPTESPPTPTADPTLVTDSTGVAETPTAIVAPTRSPAPSTTPNPEPTTASSPSPTTTPGTVSDTPTTSSTPTPEPLVDEPISDELTGEPTAPADTAAPDDTTAPADDTAADDTAVHDTSSGDTVSDGTASSGSAGTTSGGTSSGGTASDASNSDGAGT